MDAGIRYFTDTTAANYNHLKPYVLSQWKIHEAGSDFCFFKGDLSDSALKLILNPPNYVVETRACRWWQISLEVDEIEKFLSYDFGSSVILTLLPDEYKQLEAGLKNLSDRLALTPANQRTVFEDMGDPPCFAPPLSPAEFQEFKAILKGAATKVTENLSDFIESE